MICKVGWSIEVFRGRVVAKLGVRVVSLGFCGISGKTVEVCYFALDF